MYCFVQFYSKQKTQIILPSNIFVSKFNLLTESLRSSTTSANCSSDKSSTTNGCPPVSSDYFEVTIFGSRFNYVIEDSNYIGYRLTTDPGKTIYRRRHLL